jgi:hypothetical protein
MPQEKGRILSSTNSQVFSTAGSVTEKFDPIAWSQPDIEEAFITLQHWAFDVSARLVISC